MTYHCLREFRGGGGGGGGWGFNEKQVFYSNVNIFPSLSI